MNASAERADTIAINRRMTHFDGHSQVFVRLWLADLQGFPPY
jgi:hypothetical protein